MILKFQQVIHTIKSKHVGYGAMQSMVAQHSLGGLNLHSGGLANSGLSLLGGGASGLASHGNLGLTAGEALGGGGATGISVDEFLINEPISCILLLSCRCIWWW